MRKETNRWEMGEREFRENRKKNSEVRIVHGIRVADGHVICVCVCLNARVSVRRKTKLRRYSLLFACITYKRSRLSDTTERVCYLQSTWTAKRERFWFRFGVKHTTVFVFHLFGGEYARMLDDKIQMIDKHQRVRIRHIHALHSWRTHSLSLTLYK